MTQIMMVAMLAVTVEALVEYGKSIVDSLSCGGWKIAGIQIVATVVSVVLCLLADADIFGMLGVPLGAVGGRVLTGILVARGSNYLSDFIQRLTAAKIAK